MTNKEAIDRIRKHMERHGIDKYTGTDLTDALNMAIEALSVNQVPDLTKMVPLTVEELRGMDGQPVWCVSKIEDDVAEWMIIDSRMGVCEGREYIADFIEIGNLWIAYAYQPAHIDREAFCGEWQGEADGYADGELVYDVWRCGDCGHVEETDDPDLLPRFCPSCGRAMTPEAWAELEKRMGVRV